MAWRTIVVWDTCDRVTHVHRASAATRASWARSLLDPEFRVFQAGAAYAGSIVAQRRKAEEKLDTKN